MVPIIALTYALIVCPCLDDWVSDGGTAHNYLNTVDTTWSDFRTVNNFSGAPITIDSKEDHFQRNRSVVGSSNSAPTWSTKFATIVDPADVVDIYVTTPRTGEATLAAYTGRTWSIEYTYEDGQEQWKNVATLEVTNRVRNWHLDYAVKRTDTVLYQGGGGGS